MDLSALLPAADPSKVTEYTSPIPCLGFKIHTSDAHEYDCEYEHAPICEDCIVNGGNIDPRTGKRFAVRKQVKTPKSK